MRGGKPIKTRDEVKKDQKAYSQLRVGEKKKGIQYMRGPRQPKEQKGIP